MSSEPVGTRFVSSELVGTRFVSSEPVGTRFMSSELVDSITAKQVPGTRGMSLQALSADPGTGGIGLFICDQQISEPDAMSFSGVIRMTLPSASSAQRIMPWDSMPASLAGFKLVMTMTFLPTISSGV